MIRRDKDGCLCYSVGGAEPAETGWDRQRGVFMVNAELFRFLLFSKLISQSAAGLRQEQEKKTLG